MIGSGVEDVHEGSSADIACLAHDVVVVVGKSNPSSWRQKLLERFALGRGTQVRLLENGFVANYVSKEVIVHAVQQRFRAVLERVPRNRLAA